MNPIFIFAAVVTPIIVGVLSVVIPFKTNHGRRVFIETFVILNSLLVASLIIGRPAGSYEIVRFTGDITLSFRIDGLGKVFSGLAAALWPLATLYAFSYMEHEKGEKTFFLFYTATYGVTLGIAFAEDIVTMYFFYELLTLMTVPLVMHTLSREAVLAARKYLYYSLGGAAFGFIGMIFVTIYCNTPDFIYGGTLDLVKVGDRTNVLLLIYVLSFFGFGVKAAVCPFNSWLPDAGVAPTPVTALLHAVAVVKAGAFAIMRFTYFCYGAEFVRGTWAQNIVLTATIITIVYGCSRAVKETHLKRRLAFSTISNLSYILFGVAIMTPQGLVGALTHMVFHAVMKICSFLCAGTIIVKSGESYIDRMEGIGRKMPITLGIFTLAALGLTGVPFLPGFISKWNLCRAAVLSSNPLARLGIAALLISALLTAIYMLSFVVRAFFLPAVDSNKKVSYWNEPGDPDIRMLLPFGIFVVLILFFGLHPAGILSFFDQVARI